MNALVEVVAKTLMEAVGTDWDDVESKQDAYMVAKAAIAAIHDAGYVIAPREVDAAMREEFFNALAAWKSRKGQTSTNVAGDIYKAFIDAAPNVLEAEK